MILRRIPRRTNVHQLADSSTAWFGVFLVLGVLGWLSSNSAFEGFAAALIVVGLLSLAYNIFR